MALDLTAFDLEDFSFWDVNDDSLFTDHDVYLAALGDYGEGDIGIANNSNFVTNPDGTTSMIPTNPNQQQQIVPQQNPSHSHHASRPKVLLSKNDKRRQYAKLFSEAFNSGDGKQLLNFLESYCTPNCEVIQTCVVKENPYIPKHVEVKGIEAIHRYWTNTFLTIPDCLIVMLETKLRIKNPHRQALASGSSGNVAQKSDDNIPTVQSGAISRSEGSSIVSSFSFTGTKLYNMDMQNAVIKNTIEDGNPSGGKNSKKDTNNSLKAMIPAGNKHIQALINKSQKNSKKRSLGADWPSHSNDDPSGDGDGNTGQVVPSKESSGSSSVANTHHDISDRYNIFLHPPRRFSTLAGTPFGGSSNHYYHPPKTHAKNAGKPIDFVEITSSTTIQPGPYMESEGHINFLGTLTMFLDAENKISRFEFLYSHMD